MTLEATNASVFKYYIHDLPDIIDVSLLNVSDADYFKKLSERCENVQLFLRLSLSVVT